MKLTRGLVGIESERNIVDCRTGAAMPIANNVLAYARPRFPDASRIEPELPQTILEWKSPPFDQFADIESRMISEWELLDLLAKNHDARLVGFGIHPTLRIPPGKDRSFWTFNVERYEWIYDTYLAARRFIPATTHFHFSASTLQEAVLLMNWMRPFLPHFLWLSLNAPIFEGKLLNKLTGRMDMWRRFEDEGGIIGVPQTFTHATSMVDWIRRLIQMGSIDRVKSIWHYLRIHLHGENINPLMPYDGPEDLVEAITVELRICDAIHSIAQTLGIGAFGQGVANTCLTIYDLLQTNLMTIPTPQLFRSETIEKDIKAVELHGSDAQVHHPLTGEMMPVWLSTLQLLKWVRLWNTIEDSSWTQHLEFVDRYVERRQTLSDQLMRVFIEGGEEAAQLFMLQPIA